MLRNRDCGVGGGAHSQRNDPSLVSGEHLLTKTDGQETGWGEERKAELCPSAHTGSLRDGLHSLTKGDSSHEVPFPTQVLCEGASSLSAQPLQTLGEVKAPWSWQQHGTAASLAGVPKHCVYFFSFPFLLFAYIFEIIRLLDSPQTTQIESVPAVSCQC